MCQMFYGITVADLLRLAYEMASVNNLVVPTPWHTLKSAGEKWYRGFRKRNPQLSLRTPEG